MVTGAGFSHLYSEQSVNINLQTILLATSREEYYKDLANLSSNVMISHFAKYFCMYSVLLISFSPTEIPFML
jgi:hypothetical protein